MALRLQHSGCMQAQRALGHVIQHEYLPRCKPQLQCYTAAFATSAANRNNLKAFATQCNRALIRPAHPAAVIAQPQHRTRPSAEAPVRASGLANQPTQNPGHQNPGITVRPLQPSDKARWEELFRDYITWYKANVADDVIQLCWQRLMEGGEVVGLAHVLLHRSTWCATHYCYHEDLYVGGKIRAQGVGQTLIEAVYDLADKNKAQKVYWQTHEMNYWARGLYDKMGRKSQFILYEREWNG